MGLPRRTQNQESKNDFLTEASNQRHTSSQFIKDPVAPMKIGGKASEIQPIGAAYDKICALRALLADRTR